MSADSPSIQITSGEFDTDDGVFTAVAGEGHPRVQISPQGKILRGGGGYEPRNFQVIVADVAIHARDTSGTYPAMEIDPIADTADWVTAGGPAMFEVEVGDRVAINNALEPKNSGIFDWDGTEFTRTFDALDVRDVHAMPVFSRVTRSHFSGAPLATPRPLYATAYASDPDGVMGEVDWTMKFCPDMESVIELVTAMLA